MDVTVRPFRDDDAAALGAILGENGQLAHPDIDGPEAMRRVARCGASLFLVAEAEGCVAGMVRAVYDGSRAMIHQLSVRRELQGRGIGRLLAGRACEELAARGAPTVSVTVTEGSSNYLEETGIYGDTGGTHAEVPYGRSGMMFPRTLVMAAGSAVLLWALSRGDGVEGRVAAPPVDPARIVSLSPSLTRQMIDLDAGDLLAGVTNYCPPGAKAVVVSTIVQPNLEKIFLLRPDAVLLAAGDVIASHAPRLEALGLYVHCFGTVRNFHDLAAQYLELGSLLGRRNAAELKLRRYRVDLASIRRARGVRCAFFVSHNPLVAAGGNSFIDAVIRDAGGENVFGGVEIPYPIVSMETLAVENPEVIISMMPGAEEFFMKTFEEAPGLSALRHRRVTGVGTEHLPYYTPGDYLASVRLVAGILRGSGGER